MVIFINDIINLDGSDWTPNHENDISKNLIAITEALSCCPFHFKGKLVHSSSGMAKLFKNLELLKPFAEDYFMTNPLDQLRILIRDLASEDADNRRVHKATSNYQYITQAGTRSINVNNTLLAEASEYLLNHQKVLLLSMPASDLNFENPVHISIGSIVPPPNIITVNFPVALDKTLVISWIKSKQIARKFNLNPKHGENGKNARPNKGEIVSTLNCSKEEAQKYLNEAVYYSKTSELFYLDTTLNKFLVFKSENTPDNTYHGYHVDKENDVPHEVRKYLQNVV